MAPLPTETPQHFEEELAIEDSKGPRKAEALPLNERNSP